MARLYPAQTDIAADDLFQPGGCHDIQRTGFIHPIATTLQYDPIVFSNFHRLAPPEVVGISGIGERFKARGLELAEHRHEGL